MNSTLRSLSFGAMLATLGIAAACDSNPVGTDENGPRGAAVIDSNITSNRTLYADTVYTLRGFVHVTDGATLTIQPGTRIEGDYNTLGSSLFVLRGAKIMAEGTRERPIVFTSSQPVGQRRAGDWGGLIIVGRGIINRASPVILEGTGTGPNNPQVDYSGGTDNNDNSGVLRYVRIEFAGFATAQDAELNSLTLAAVGRGTRIEYVQVLYGLDDSFEWFGGAVDGKYLISYESGDDHFDAAEGYIGRNQYLIAYQSRIPEIRPGAGSVATDAQGFEVDGCHGAGCFNGQNSEPLTVPVFANFTMVGPGTGTGQEGPAGGIGMMLRRGAGGHYVNGVVTRYPRAAISLRDEPTRTRSNEGNLVLNNILVADNGVTFLPQGTAANAPVQFTIDMAQNRIAEASGAAATLFVRLPSAPVNGADFDWAPSVTSAARTGGLTTFPAALQQRGGNAIVPTSYRGAADPAGTNKWWEGWTYYGK